MPTKVLQTEQEIEDFVRGCTFLGTGGGGNPKDGLPLLLETFRSGKKIQWVDVDEIEDEKLTTAPAGMGSIAPLSPERIKILEQLGLKEKKVKRPLIEAVRELEKYLQAEVEVIVPIEIGGGNTPISLDTAAQLGKVMVDGDYTGRAIPEAGQSLPAIYNKKITPMACVDDWGNITIIKEVVNLAVAERLGKLISTVTTGLCGEASFTMKAKEMKEVLVLGTLTKCLQIGKKIREAREKGIDPVQAVIEEVDGWLLFKGRVIKRETEDKEGYYWGTNILEGLGEFQGHTFKIWFKNENHISWLDEVPYVTSPDIIQVVDLEMAEPITNTDLKEGTLVAVVGAKNERYRTEKGIELLGPRHYGFDLDYIPIEKRVKG